MKIGFRFLVLKCCLFSLYRVLEKAPFLLNSHSAVAKFPLLSGSVYGFKCCSITFVFLFSFNLGCALFDLVKLTIFLVIQSIIAGTQKS